MLKYLLSLSCLILILPACRNGGEDQFLTESDIIGVWVVTEFDNNYRLTGSFAGQELDESGQSQITDSDLQLIFTDNGRWQSSGNFTATVTTGNERQVTEQSGIGAGSWSFSQDTLYMTGLRSYNETGYFMEDQPLVLNSFEKQQMLDFGSFMDVTESDEAFNVNIRTRSNFDILLVR